MEGQHQYRSLDHEPTQRQLEILSLVREGYANKQIGVIFDMPTNTIKSHLARVMERLGAVDRTSAVIIAIRQGYLPIGIDRATEKQLADLKAMRETSWIKR